MLGRGAEFQCVLHSSTSGGSPEWQKILSHSSFHCFSHIPAWYDPFYLPEGLQVSSEVQTAKDLGGCRMPRKDADFLSSLWAVVPTQCQPLHASEFLGSSTWQASAAAGLWRGMSAGWCRVRSWFLLGDRVG